MSVEIATTADIKAMLEPLHVEIQNLKRTIEGATLVPAKPWYTIPEYADLIGKTTRTVRRHIDLGTLETCERAGVTLIKAPEA